MYCVVEQSCGADGLNPCSSNSEECVPLPASCDGKFSCPCVHAAYKGACQFSNCGQGTSDTEYKYLLAECD